MDTGSWAFIRINAGEPFSAIATSYRMKRYKLYASILSFYLAEMLRQKMAQHDSDWAIL